MAGYCLQKHQHRPPYSGKRTEHLPGHDMHRQQVIEATKHFFGLEYQGVMAKVVTEAVTKKAITLWSNTVHELTASSFKFVRKAFQQLLPTTANLVRWKRITDPVC